MAIADLTVSALKQGMNACLLYDDGDDPIRIVAPYVAAGLAAGERCVYIVGEHDPERFVRALSEAGVDVEREQDRGALVMVERWEVSFPGGEFDPAAMIGYVRLAIQDALAAGFAGLRVLAEMTWALQLGVGANRLIHYEGLGCGLYPDEPLVAICLYNRSRFPERVCRDALRTHPLVAIGARVYENLFYDLDEATLDRADAEAKIDWMLTAITSTSQDVSERLGLERAQRDFLAMTAHELRNPLSTVRGLAQFMRRHGTYNERALDGIVDQTEQLERLVGDLLDASRLHSGRLELRREWVDLVALARSCVDLARAQSDAHTIGLEAADPPLTGYWDPYRLRQVLANLLGNAVKYSPDGGEIAVRVEASGDWVAVSVRDHGAGIAPEALPKVFDRFYRADGAAGRRDGLGLGLYITRGIVEAHGGQIGVRSERGRGSTFCFSLPRSQLSPMVRLGAAPLSDRPDLAVADGQAVSPAAE